MVYIGLLTALGSLLHHHHHHHRNHQAHSQATISNQQLNAFRMAPIVTKKYKAAAVNAEPGWLDLELSVEKTIHWINEAGKNGCKLIAFPELCKSENCPYFHIETCHLQRIVSVS
jgi:hypothetical protein